MRPTHSRARVRIDAFAAAWSDVRDGVCRAAEPGDVDAATACLDDGQTRLQVLLERMASPDPAVLRMAVWAASSLPDPHACVDARAALLHADLDRALALANKARESWRAMGPAKAESAQGAEALIGALERAKREDGSIGSSE